MNITNIVRECLDNNKLDHKTMQYWELSITNQLQTIEDFKKFVMNTDIYKAVSKKRFDEVLVNLKLEIEEEYANNLFNTWLGNGNNSKNNAQLFIAKTTYFLSAYTNVIKDFISYELNVENPSSEHVKYYLNKFSNVEGYSIIYLVNDIQTRQHEELTFDTAGADVSGVSVSASANANANANASGASVVYDRNYLNAFEEKFQRAMYVQEYFKYIGLSNVNWNNVHQEHNLNFNKLREIFEKYTGKTISEYYYVNKYLDQIDDVDFFDNIIDLIVSSNDYKQSMCRILAEKYKNMFDQNLEETDVLFIFDIVKKQKLDIKNESLTLILSNLKEETDDIISHIFKQFMYVLDRAPDMYDIDQYIQFYRHHNNDSLEVNDKHLQNVLIKTLEYHDIIKKRIKHNYYEKYQKEILQSKMFDILNKIIININNHEEIDANINALL